jgi:hypothetical protein
MNDRNTYSILMRKPGGNRPLGRPVSRIILKWIFDCKNGLLGTGLMWLKGALVSTVMNLLVQDNVGNILSSLTTDVIHRSAQLHHVTSDMSKRNVPALLHVFILLLQ